MLKVYTYASDPGPATVHLTRKKEVKIVLQDGEPPYPYTVLEPDALTILSKIPPEIEDVSTVDPWRGTVDESYRLEWVITDPGVAHALLQYAKTYTTEKENAVKIMRDYLAQQG